MALTSSTGTNRGLSSNAGMSGAMFTERRWLDTVTGLAFTGRPVRVEFKIDGTYWYDENGHRLVEA